MQEPLAKIIKDISLKFNDIEYQKKLSHEFLFDITSVCNLNCTNCSVFCGLREPYFITVEEFSVQLKNLRDKVPVSFISFCGGEPTLHPQFMDLCKELFNQIPDCYLQIITNGTLLNKFSEEDLQFLSKYNVCFTITIYPKIEYIKIVENFENKCKTTYSNIKIDFKGIRPYFGKYDYNAYGDNDPDNFYYFCEKSHQCHSFVIFKNRLYNCCIAPDYNAINLPKDEFDSISMDNLPSYEDILNFGNHSYNSCKYWNIFLQLVGDCDTALEVCLVRNSNIHFFSITCQGQCKRFYNISIRKCYGCNIISIRSFIGKFCFGSNYRWSSISINIIEDN